MLSIFASTLLYKNLVDHYCKYLYKDTVNQFLLAVIYLNDILLPKGNLIKNILQPHDIYNLSLRYIMNRDFFGLLAIRHSLAHHLNPQ